MNVEDLNGYIGITYSYDAGSDAIPLMDAKGVILHGRFVAIDIGGCTCAGTITRFVNQQATYECIWDASRADPDVFLPDENGRPTRGLVIFQGTLSVSTVDNKLIAAGQIQHGPLAIRVGIHRMATFGG